ncbi:MAG TPA: hypothetical protein ENG87_00520 [Candidatus Pacearchaeota archaeon]|nr:hypothetical protein BMS3Abin17_00662 [archaeon BMS3Abin17]HDK41832.1 hypothetical protein [Candidatus Pacearchaeota archaeon]HDZ60524.1 hypothetical protein [Candidatus Pacearchaeota archaeon]
MDENQVNDLLKDVKIDKERIKKSIYTILDMYHLKLGDVSVSRKKLDSSEIFVAAVEECNLADAKRIMEEKYPDILPAPITILEFKGKYVLFMGSNRSVIFVLKDKKPDCIIVKIPDTIKEPMIVSEAKSTLKQIIEKQK